METKRIIRKILSILLVITVLLAVEEKFILAKTIQGDVAENVGQEMPSNPVHHCTQKSGTDTTD